MSAPPVASHGLTVRGRRVAELSDAELEAEAQLRRSARARAPHLVTQKSHAVSAPQPPTASNAPVGRLLVRRELEQYLANLELKPGATLDTVREQYFRLRERYDPKKQSSEEKRRVAQALVDKLMGAYEALSAHYEAKGEV
ncbi:MAG: hypothetical protein KC593_24640 [Myxococcales bacterium]|nr:hypothetical protein [Myxococcales bacterium]MCB9625775.1 hypothetical protein [Sandaracinaceae bacterium]